MFINYIFNCLKNVTVMTKAVTTINNTTPTFDDKLLNF